MSEEFNPSRCEIIKAIITSHDDSQRLDVSGNFIGKFKLSQSMTSVAYKGSAFCLDTQGILESFPLRGEEKLELHIKAFDLGTTIKLKTVAILEKLCYNAYNNKVIIIKKRS